MRARLTVVAGVAEPLVHDLDCSRRVRLGRNRSNTIIIDDTHTSRRHAEIFYENDNWHIRDLQPTNPTKINGRRLEGTVTLKTADEINIGNAKLRFSTEPSKEGTEEQRPLPPPIPEMVLPDSSQTTTLHADELNALFHFMNKALLETTPRGLVTLALAVAHKHTQADVVGFLGLDEEDPQLKIVLPERSEVDAHLSRELTKRVLREGRRVWLGGEHSVAMESESLLAYRDAMCVPLPPGPQGDKQTPPGALHVYRSNGALGEREVRFCEVLAACLANALHVLRARRALEADVSRLRTQSHQPGEVLLGESQAVREVRRQIARLADCPCTVLITGESGVGKELVAIGLHNQSRRADGPMVALNCSAIPKDLAEAELFGNVKGAFTGADHERLGFFQQADDGTLFLDEIGELSPELQVKLLRVLETRSVRPVGGEREIKVDVRVIAATNRDLELEVKEKRFRKDLFYRLGAPLKVPPLREHLEDVPLLVEHFLKSIRDRYRRRVTLSEAALLRMQTYTWPGNVRQLLSVLEVAVAMTDEGGTIHAGDLRLAGDANEPTGLPSSLNLQELEEWAIRKALAETGGVNTRAALVLGINRETLINKIKKYRIERRSDQEEEKGPR
jgi:DNA-binding NtrC family response regulator